MPDPATVTDARSVAETRLTNLAAATLVDAPSTVPVIRSLLRASAYPTAGPDGAVTYPAVVESVHDAATPSASSASSGRASLTIPSPRGLSGSRCAWPGSTPQS